MFMRWTVSGNLTPKQEKFCQLYVETGNASEAYRGSYDASKMKPDSVNRKAKELLDNVKIAARLKQIRERHVKRHEVTVDSLVGELEEARLLALELAQPSAAVSASMGKAKIYGLDRQVIEQVTTHKLDKSLAERLSGGSKK